MELMLIAKIYHSFIYFMKIKLQYFNINNTPLIYACEKSESISQYLISNGADVNITNNDISNKYK